MKLKQNIASSCINVTLKMFMIIKIKEALFISVRVITV